MVLSEYLAISAIFLTGLVIGFKLRTAIYNFKNYLIERKKITN